MGKSRLVAGPRLLTSGVASCVPHFRIPIREQTISIFVGSCSGTAYGNPWRSIYSSQRCGSPSSRALGLERFLFALRSRPRRERNRLLCIDTTFPLSGFNVLNQFNQISFANCGLRFGLSGTIDIIASNICDRSSQSDQTRLLARHQRFTTNKADGILATLCTKKKERCNKPGFESAFMATINQRARLGVG